jgi:hypothetical protein
MGHQLLKKDSAACCQLINGMVDIKIASVLSTYVGYFGQKFEFFCEAFILQCNPKHSSQTELTCMIELLLVATLRSFLTPPPKSIAQV